MHASAKPLLVAVVLVLSGCVGSSGSTTFFSEDIPLPVELSLKTQDASGAKVFRIESPAEPTLYLRYEFLWSRTAFNPVQIVFITDEGETIVPRTLRAEYGSEPNEANVRAGPLSQGTANPGSADFEVSSGAELIEVPHRASYLVVSWENLTAGLSVRTYWTEGTTVREIPASLALAATLAETRGGVLLQTPHASASQDAQLKMGSTGRDNLVNLKLHRASSRIEIHVQDAEGERSFRMDDEVSLDTRLIFTSRGATTITFRGAALYGSELYLLGTTADALPHDVVHFQNETSRVDEGFRRR